MVLVLFLYLTISGGLENETAIQERKMKKLILILTLFLVAGCDIEPADVHPVRAEPFHRESITPDWIKEDRLYRIEKQQQMKWEEFEGRIGKLEQRLDGLEERLDRLE